ncbi:hypothetical protein VHUM_00806 [Vanrija humicola]|uniref:Uncharacterized protein n=1 Tax=Vanrija humicola TaxID=5417 RepID=A0A7D8V3U6_VANHU|nr:hypothetical protein VHUM_00806 [Vanrija humicola]
MVVGKHSAHRTHTHSSQWQRQQHAGARCPSPRRRRQVATTVSSLRPIPQLTPERPITTEEQEAEIAALRRKNEVAKRKQEQGLDMLVIVAIIVSSAQLAYANVVDGAQPIRYLVPASQAFLLLYSLTPGWIPPLREASENRHSNYVAIQLLLFTIGFFAIQNSAPELADFMRLALPELAAGAVEIQRRGQKDNQARLAQLEELKYDLKGA